jgi:hypothetical protein
MSIESSLNHLWATLQAECKPDRGDEIVIYVPAKVWGKLQLELMQKQRIVDPINRNVGHESDIVMFDFFRLRRAHELDFLETTIEKIRRMVA